MRLQARRQLIESDPFLTAFDEYAQRASAYEIVSRNVEHALTDESDSGASKQVIEAPRAVHNDDSGLCIDDPSISYHVLLKHSEAGMLLGAALMYEMLKAGAR